MAVGQVTSLILLLVAAASAADKQFHYPVNCAKPHTTQSGNGVSGPVPPLPVLPDVFQTRVEATFVEKQKTTTAQEFYDGPGSRAAIHVIRNNTENRAVFDYRNNQSLTVLNGVCQVSDLTFDPNQMYLGLRQASNGYSHYYTTKGVLTFSKHNGLTYMGKTTIRGINVDHWQSCMYWDSLGSNFTTDYYFSVYNWTDAVLYPQIPIRAEVKGYRTPPVTGVSHFHHFYEYFDFRSQLWGDQLSPFQTPPGVICPGRKHVLKMPTFNNQMSWREEIVSPDMMEIIYADVWHDYTNKLSRFDYRPSYSTEPFYTTNPLTVVHDFSSGVAYTRDKTRGNCSILPIQSHGLDVLRNSNKNSRDGQSQFVVRMKSSNELFFLDNSTTITYGGQREVRGILCDSYIYRTTAFHLPGYDTFTTTFELYFSSDTWTTSNIIGKETASRRVPVRFDLKSDSWVGYQASYNIYNFKQGEPAFDTFDVSSCFDDSSKQTFTLEFSGNYDDSMYQYKSVFLQAVYKMLLRRTHMSRLQIQKLDLHVFPEATYVTGVLLEAPPAISYFTKLAPEYKDSSTGKELTEPDAQACARACNSDENPPCNSFKYCHGESLCSLRENFASDAPLVPTLNTVVNCSYYGRTAPSKPFEIPLSRAWLTLKNTVVAKAFKIDVNMDGKNRTFTATSVADNNILTDNRHSSTKSKLQDFNVQVNKAIPGYDDLILTGLAVDDCAVSCQDHPNWVCNSFQYCFDTGYCVLSKIYPDRRPQVVVNKPLCNLYSKKYIADYDLVPGLTAFTSSDTIYQNIVSADQCAALCSNFNQFSCKSFDYCDSISSCVLRRVHSPDVQKTTAQMTPSCVHFSKKDFFDFKFVHKATMIRPGGYVISKVNVKECAKLCVSEDSFSCTSFDYCGETMKCSLSADTATEEFPGEENESFACDVYNRELFPNITQTHAINHSVVPTEEVQPIG